MVPVHQVPEHVAHGGSARERRLAKVAAACAVGAAGGVGVEPQRVSLRDRKRGLVERRGHVLAKPLQVGHLHARHGDLRVVHDSLQLGLPGREAAARKRVKERRLGRRVESYARALRLHRGRSDAGGMARVDRGLHVVRLHQAVVIGEHDAVDPPQLCRGAKAALHVAVGAEAEEPYLAAPLGRLGPGPYLGLVHAADVVHAVHEVEVDMVGLEPFQRLVEQPRHVVRAVRARGLGDEEDLLPRVGIASETSQCRSRCGRWRSSRPCPNR